MFDPYTNVLAAYSIWKDAGGSWRPWSTFNSGAYRNAHDTPESGTLTPVGIGSRGTSAGGVGGIPVGGYLKAIGAGLGVLGPAIPGVGGFVEAAANPTQAAGAAVSDYAAANGFLSKLSDRNLWNKIGLGAIAVAVMLLGIVIWIEPDAVKAVSKLPIIPV